MTHRTRPYLYLFAGAVALLLLPVGSALAFEGFDESVVAKYPTATNLESCGTCHNDFSPGSTSLNPYGQDVDGALSGFNIDQALTDVESTDSDGDGTTNLDEIESGDGFFPGWTCETYTNATDGPSDLADLVDPVDPGCDGSSTTTTSSTVTSTSTSTSTNTSTSTSLPGEDQCSQPVSSGAAPVSTDCLYILQAAVSLQTCSPECICAPTGTLPVKATDALLCLNVAVGVNLPLNCPCNGGTSTTVTSSTVTSTTETSTTVSSTSTTEDSTTSTSTSSTTTTLGAG